MARSRSRSFIRPLGILFRSVSRQIMRSYGMDQDETEAANQDTRPYPAQAAYQAEQPDIEQIIQGIAGPREALTRPTRNVATPSPARPVQAQREQKPAPIQRETAAAQPNAQNTPANQPGNTPPDGFDQTTWSRLTRIMDLHKQQDTAPGSAVKASSEAPKSAQTSPAQTSPAQTSPTQTSPVQRQADKTADVQNMAPTLPLQNVSLDEALSDTTDDAPPVSQAPAYMPGRRRAGGIIDVTPAPPGQKTASLGQGAQNPLQRQPEASPPAAPDSPTQTSQQFTDTLREEIPALADSSDSDESEAESISATLSDAHDPLEDVIARLTQPEPVEDSSESERPDLSRQLMRQSQSPANTPVPPSAQRPSAPQKPAAPQLPIQRQSQPQTKPVPPSAQRPNVPQKPAAPQQPVQRQSEGNTPVSPSAQSPNAPEKPATQQTPIQRQSQSPANTPVSPSPQSPNAPEKSAAPQQPIQRQSQSPANTPVSPSAQSPNAPKKSTTQQTPIQRQNTGTGWQTPSEYNAQPDNAEALDSDVGADIEAQIQRAEMPPAESAAQRPQAPLAKPLQRQSDPASPTQSQPTEGGARPQPGPVSQNPVSRNPGNQNPVAPLQRSSDQPGKAPSEAKPSQPDKPQASLAGPSSEPSAGPVAGLDEATLINLAVQRVTELPDAAQSMQGSNTQVSRSSTPSALTRNPNPAQPVMRSSYGDSSSESLYQPTDEAGPRPMGTNPVQRRDVGQSASGRPPAGPTVSQTASPTPAAQGEPNSPQRGLAAELLSMLDLPDDTPVAGLDDWNPPTESTQATIQRDDEAAGQPPQFITPAQMRPLQREAAPPPADSASPAVAEESGEGGEEGAEPDIDQLAKAVFAKLKDRLRAERERRPRSL